jgi:thiamine pyrophosphokinase
MSEGICYIVGAGENYGIDFVPHVGDYIIAADGGYSYLEKAAIAADLIIGDFDTLHNKPSHSNTITLLKEKDETDTFAALQHGIEKGYKTFHIYCGTGGRVEHTIANIQLLAYLSENNMHGFLVGQNSIITAITNTKMLFPQYAKGYVSIFSHSEKSYGVFLKGLKYELDNAVLTNTFPIGVSNEFIGKDSSVFVNNGTLLVVFPRDVKREIDIAGV